MSDEIKFYPVKDFRVVVEDITEGKGEEFLASIYSHNLELLSEAWEATPEQAVHQAVTDLFKNK